MPVFEAIESKKQSTSVTQHVIKRADPGDNSQHLIAPSAGSAYPPAFERHIAGQGRSIMTDQNQSTLLKWGTVAYRYRSFTPVPLLLIALWLSNPNVTTILIGSVFAAIGEMIRMLAMFETHNKTSTRGNEASSSALVTSGIYTRTRNPLYLGALFTGLGYMSVAGNSYLIAGFLLLFAVQYYLIIRYEENYLQGQFPEEFAAFIASTPRFFPRLFGGDKVFVMPDGALLRGSLHRERSTILGIVVIITLLANAPALRALIS